MLVNEGSLRNVISKILLEQLGLTSEDTKNDTSSDISTRVVVSEEFINRYVKSRLR